MERILALQLKRIGDVILTLPALADSIQLLPIWEPGVVESLYGIAGWNLNRQFFYCSLESIFNNMNRIKSTGETPGFFSCVNNQSSDRFKLLSPLGKLFFKAHL